VPPRNRSTGIRDQAMTSSINYPEASTLWGEAHHNTAAGGNRGFRYDFRPDGLITSSRGYQSVGFRASGGGKRGAGPAVARTSRFGRPEP